MNQVGNARELRNNRLHSVFSRLGPTKSSSFSFGLIGVVIIWNAWQLRATADKVAYLNDSSMHEQMVRFANCSFAGWDVPFLRWFPYLNVGSPHFLHYQGLGASLAGLAGLVVGPDFAFRWALYLLLVAWPITIYASARIFRLSRPAATAAAVLSPFMASVPLVGYEQKAYLWIGFGMFAQLCASWALPFAWALTWRALDDRRYIFKAVLLIALTVAFHFETGYFALGAIVVFPFLKLVGLKTRIKRAVVLLLGSLAATSWVTIPLLVNAKWAAVNSALAQTGLVRGYGARQDLSWLFHGQTFDNGRLPVISIAVAVGVVTAIVHWKRNSVNRPLLVMFVISLLLSFGPTTWGSLINFLPGHADIYFRRFLLGIQLSGIYLAGVGVAALASFLLTLFARRPASILRAESPVPKNRTRAVFGISIILIVLLAIPAVLELRTYDHQNAGLIGTQRQSEATYGPQINSIISYIKSHPSGRTYAGLPSNWGMNFTVGYVPVFKYIQAFDVDEIGYTLRTASLMSQPEFRFQESNPSDYKLFGIHYLILPWLKKPPVPAVPVMTRGAYELWQIPTDSYLSVVKPSGSIDENKSTVGVQSTYVLNTRILAQHVDMTVNWAVPTLFVNWPTESLGRAPGSVLISTVNLANGTATATVSMDQPANLMLSASYDPGWHATVDGNPVPTVMLAPAVVSVPVPAGIHVVTFIYQGFPWFYEGVALSAASLIVLFFLARGTITMTSITRRLPRPRRRQHDPPVN
jgi:hypothetical protein